MEISDPDYPDTIVTVCIVDKIVAHSITKICY